MSETLLDIAMQHADSLIINAQLGDGKAFNKLVSLWYKRIYNFGFKYFGEHDLAMEITQKTFISVHRNISSLREIESFKAWLYRIALNHCHDEDRRIKRKKVIPLFDTEGGIEKEANNLASNNIVDAPDGRLHQKELSAIVVKYLNQLSEEQREIVIMKEYEGLKFREIADILAISENTAKSRLYYGLKAMKKYFVKANVSLESYSYE